jgi:hypothetical protein
MVKRSDIARDMLRLVNQTAKPERPREASEFRRRLKMAPTRAAEAAIDKEIKAKRADRRKARRGINLQNLERLLLKGERRLQERTWFHRLVKIGADQWTLFHAINPVVVYFAVACKTAHEAKYPGWAVNDPPPLRAQKPQKVARLIPLTEVDGQGRQTTRFFGDSMACWGQFMPGGVELAEPHGADRDKLICQLHDAGLSNQEIADKLAIDERTVRRALPKEQRKRKRTPPKKR